MERIGEKKHGKLGVIKCKPTISGGESWCKEIELRLLSCKKSMINEYLNYYCFNNKFEYDLMFQEKAKRADELIVEMHNIFLESIEELEDTLFRYYIDELRPETIIDMGIEFADEMVPYISSKKELYELLKLQDVRIFTNKFVVVCECQWDSDGIAMVKYGTVDKDRNGYIEIRTADNIECTEMYIY